MKSHSQRLVRSSPPGIAIVGAGHVGVVYAAGFASLGHSVWVIDVDRERLTALRDGKLWFYEPGLEELLLKGIRQRRISFTKSYRIGLRRARFAFVCVPTPTTENGSLDDSYIKAAYEGIRGNQTNPLIVVNKSTVSIGTVDLAMTVFGRRRAVVVSNPEFLAEGTAVHDFFNPSRIIIGARSSAAGDAVARLYRPLGAPIVRTDPVTAELTKLAANAYLATKVSFANAIAEISQAVGANSADIVHGLGTDPRIGSGHLKPGLGFGGSCLPKDLAAVEHLARRFSSAGDLFAAVQVINKSQRSRIIDVLVATLGSVAKRRIAILGASFKAHTDDIRESPALAIARELAGLHAIVRVYDPVAGAKVAGLGMEGVVVVQSAMRAMQGADATIIATDWPQFGHLEPARVRSAMVGRTVIDARGMLDSAKFRAAGLDVLTAAGATSRSLNGAVGEPPRVS